MRRLVCRLFGHRWWWCGQTVNPVGSTFDGGRTFNARCYRCGDTTWAHGRMA